MIKLLMIKLLISHTSWKRVSFSHLKNLIENHLNVENLHLKAYPIRRVVLRNEISIDKTK